MKLTIDNFMVYIYVVGQRLRYAGPCGHCVWKLMEPHVIIWSCKKAYCYVKM